MPDATRRNLKFYYIRCMRSQGSKPSHALILAIVLKTGNNYGVSFTNTATLKNVFGSDYPVRPLALTTVSSDWDSAGRPTSADAHCSH